MSFTIQPSTRKNLLQLAGNGELANAYAQDIASLLRGDDTVDLPGEIVLTGALTAALVIASRRAERSVSGDVLDALTTASESAADALLALSEDRPTGDDVFDTRRRVLDATIFQLTDIDEQD